MARVSSTDPKKHSVRVCFEEDDNATSYDAPVLAQFTYENTSYNMPDVNEDVLCLCFPDKEDIMVLGSFYADGIEPPCNNQDVNMIKYKDETTISYDRAQHWFDMKIEETTIHADREKIDANAAKTMSLTSKENHTRHDDTLIDDSSKDIKATADDNITHNAGKDISHEAGQNISHKAGQNVSQEAGQTFVIQAGTTVTIKAQSVTIDTPQCTVTGNLAVSGNISCGGAGRAGGGGNAEIMGRLHVIGQVDSDTDVTGSGISLKGHRHTEQGDGADTSAPH